jgi:molecular chaperone DnaK (HSP70)
MPSEFCPHLQRTSSQFLTDILRRLIGRRFDDPTVKKDIESWPFKIVDDNGSPKIEVEYLGENKQFSAQEISSMVLTKVRTNFWADNFPAPALAQFLLTPPNR